MALALFASTATALAMALHKMAEYSSQAQRETMVLRRLESALTEACATRPLRPGQMESPADAAGVALRVEVSPATLRNRKGEELRDLFRVSVTAHLVQADVERRLERLVHAPAPQP